MKPLIIAHRGYSDKYPENTMLAFKKAHQSGADGIELDVHMTKDQEIIICHDEDIQRTSNGQGYIKDLTLEEIKSYQFLNNMEIEDVDELDIKAPTLEEFFAWFVTTEMMVNIEIKNNIFPYPGIENKIVALINEFQVLDRVIISSFNHHSIQRVLKIDSEVQCGFLAGATILEPGSYCQRYGADFYHPLFISIVEEDVENCRLAGTQINTWTVNEEDHFKRVIDLGVDGIITNCVELGRQIVDRV